MIRTWVQRLGRHHVDPWTAQARAEERYQALLARGVPAARAAERAARDAVSVQLVERARAGDRGARDQLVEIWLDPVHRWCRIGAGPGVAPDDAAHDALVRLVEGLDRLRDAEALYGWVWGLVWRVLREHERRARIRAWMPAAWTRSAEQEIHAAERSEGVGRILAVLPLEDRAVLTLAYLEDHSRDQIAAALDLPLGTVNRRLTRAREAFRRRAEARGLDGDALLDPGAQADDHQELA
jgi:RNA polymerase sigma-70 factor (ECF subfamily)